MTTGTSFLWRAALFALALLAAPALAQVVPPPDAAKTGQQYGGPDSPVAIVVTDAQRIALRFSDIPRLNGDYRVNADETVTVPGLGRIPVAGLTAQQFEKVLGDLATGLTGRDIYATVEVAEYRPVFVTGRVPRFGPLPWEPGLTVQQAIAAVGGVSQGGTEEAAVQRRKARFDQVRLIATMARLRAEQEEKADIPIPDNLVKLAGKPEAEKLIQMQSIVMRDRRAALRKQLELLAGAKSLATNELEFLRVQQSKIEEQLQMRRKQRDRIQALLDQKLTVADRALEEAIKVSDLEEKAVNISVSIARVQATIANFDRDALNATEVRKADADAEYIRVERELAQADAVLGLAESSASATGEGPAYSISRRKGKTAQTLPATAATPLMPGDVLTVAGAELQND